MLNNILIKLPMIKMHPATIRQFLMREVIPFMSTFLCCSLVIVLYPANIFGNLFMSNPNIIMRPPPIIKLIISIGLNNSLPIKGKNKILTEKIER